ncbi:MAG TPA: hypothetical protein PLU93_07380 [Treponemataceae bacterium]|jgi:hypothetical protein|nr:hypothetical protein [Treponemataceae bacterium]
MGIVDIVFLYAFVTSAAFTYGVGLTRSLVDSNSAKRFLAGLPICLIEALISVLALWYPTTAILVPEGLSYVVPTAVILVIGAVRVVFALALGDRERGNPFDFVTLFGTVILALWESTSVMGAVALVAGSCASIGLLTLILIAARSRASSSSADVDWRGLPLALVSMGLVFIALYAAQASWWVSEASR